MTEPVVSEAKLRYLDFLSREDRVRHHRYVEEMKQYELMKNGDLSAIGESARLWTSGLYGHVCDDPLRNAKYLFVTSITLATRFAIEGGMDEEDAFTKMLESVTHYDMDGPMLLLLSDGELRAVFQARP